MLSDGLLVLIPLLSYNVKAVLERHLDDSAVSVKWFLQSPQKQPFRQHKGSPEIM